MSILKSTVVTLSFLLSAALLPAGVLFDSTNTPLVTSGSDGVVPFGPLYQSFTSDGTGGSLSDLKLVLSATPTSGASVMVGLYSSGVSGVGSLVTNLVTISDSFLTTTPTLYDVSMLSTPTLAANTRYWIGLSDPSSTTSAFWSYNSATTGTGVLSQSFQNQSGVFADSAYGAYMMTVTESVLSLPTGGVTGGTPPADPLTVVAIQQSPISTPEPASLVLMSAGLGILALVRRRKG